MKNKVSATSLFLLVFFFLSCSRDPFDIIINNVNVVDVQTGEIINSQNIGIYDGQITVITESGLKSSLESTLVIDGTEKFIIPGLCDSHTHIAFLSTLGGDSLKTELADFVHRGVLYVRDVGGPIDVMSDMKKRITSGEIEGPEIFYTGPMLESSPLYWAHFNEALEDFTVALDDKDDVDRVLTELDEKGSDFIKTFNNIKPELYPYIVETAKQKQLKIIHDPGAPLFNWIPINKAIEMGITTIEHAKAPWPFVLKDDYRKEHDLLLRSSNDTRQQHRSFLNIIELGIESISVDRLDSLSSIMVEKNVVLCPTLLVFQEMGEMDEVPPGQEELTDVQRMGMIINKAMWEVSKYFVKSLSEKGVKMLVGQDGMDPSGTFEEMILMKEAGVTDKEVLKGATIYASEWLEIDDKYGSVEEGKIADLVLLNSNPLEDISHVRDIFKVFKHGKLMSFDTQN